LQTRVNILKVKMASPDPNISNQAQEALANWPEAQPFRGDALANLFQFYYNQEKHQKLPETARMLLSEPDAPLEKRLHALTYLESHGGKDTRSWQKAFNHECTATPEKAARWIDFQRLQDRVEDAVEWAQVLSDPVRDSLQVQLAILRCLEVLGSSEKTRSMLKQSNWDKYPEIREIAVMHWEHHGESTHAQRVRQWVKSKRNRPQVLVRLLRFSREMEWEVEQEVLLWELEEIHPDHRFTLNTLNRFYARQRDTIGLLKVARKMQAWNPSNRSASNNQAIIQLLLDKNVESATRIAEANYQHAPYQPAFTATLAFARYRQGNFAEAIALLKPLVESDEEIAPQALLYYALALEAHGNQEQARDLIGQINREKLLKEEGELLEQLFKPSEKVH